MILVDTNLLLRASQPAHSQYAAATGAVKTARLQGYRPCIVPQVIYEYWVVATRPASVNGLAMTPQDAEREVTRIVSQFDLLRDERTVYDRWLSLVVQYDVEGKTAHDARLVAAMLRHHVSHLLTFNSREFQRYTSISAIHPRDVAQLKAYK